jgi:queuine tRNA-ribosyltransferase accessory subunit
LPPDNFVVFAARRSPAIYAPKVNSNDTLSILTSVGFRDLPINQYVTAIEKVRPDIVIGIADLPNTDVPGKTRLPKMPARTEAWLKLLLDKLDRRNGEDRPAVFASVLPLEMEKQRLYIDFLSENAERLSGIVLPDSAHSISLTPELANLPQLHANAPGPHEILERISEGVDLFNVNFTNLCTDAGIALHFTFRHSAHRNAEGASNEKAPLGTDMWNPSFSTNLSPLQAGGTCYACRKHHKAYIQHCLAAKEMTAWVLLQMSVFPSPLSA